MATVSGGVSTQYQKCPTNVPPENGPYFWSEFFVIFAIPKSGNCVSVRRFPSLALAATAIRGIHQIVARFRAARKKGRKLHDLLFAAENLRFFGGKKTLFF